MLDASWLRSLSNHCGHRPVLLISEMNTVLALVPFILTGLIGSVMDPFRQAFGWEKRIRDITVLSQKFYVWLPSAGGTVST